MARGWLKIQAGIAAALFLAGCSRSGSTATPRIQLVAAETPFIEVRELPLEAQRALRRPPRAMEDWQRVLAVFVESANDEVPIAGKYSFEDGILRFTPHYPFDPGRAYDVKLGSFVTTVALPARAPSAPVFVTATYPSGEFVPENQLRMYIHFSAPMGRRGGVGHVRLLDDEGREVEMPFLPLEAEFWNADRTRYTVFFDPGRQKRGILPNRKMGPSLMEGRAYTLVVDRDWTDGNGNGLRESFTRRFRVGPPQMAALDPAHWRIAPPMEGTREPLSVTFPHPLDHALVLRAIGVAREGRVVTGETRTENHESRWLLVPSEPWRSGRYELTVLPILEDAAGNRIGRPFEVDSFARDERMPAEPGPARLPFTIAGTQP